MITVRIVAEVQDWQKDVRRIPNNKIVKIKVGYDEVDLRQKIKTLGAEWNKAEKVWQLRFDIVRDLGLSERIVDK